MSSALRKAAEAAVQGRGFDHNSPSDADIVTVIEAVARAHAERVVRGMFEQERSDDGLRYNMCLQSLADIINGGELAQRGVDDRMNRFVAAALARADEAPRG